MMENDWLVNLLPSPSTTSNLKSKFPPDSPLLWLYSTWPVKRTTTTKIKICYSRFLFLFLKCEVVIQLVSIPRNQWTLSWLCFWHFKRKFLFPVFLSYSGLPPVKVTWNSIAYSWGSAFEKESEEVSHITRSAKPPMWEMWADHTHVPGVTLYIPTSLVWP